MSYQTEELVLDDIDIKELRTLILHNDDVNTFDWVIVSLMDICRFSSEQAEQTAVLVHYKGKARVTRGDYDTLRPKRDAFIERGIKATID
ncbi:MAG: ATP-dependent Clp protease adaptor ClpS [Bacteroidetes bacterium]|jgi:ATP-dependent Clp protease adaptor protein ClpS|nr:ATP-dependent Clp protease adaptor ClpS [Bacteroidota bacterium]